MILRVARLQGKVGRSQSEADVFRVKIETR